MAMWEQLLLGAMGLLILFWFMPGIKGAFAKSESVPSDWKSVLLPIAAVFLFIVFLIATL